MDFFGDTVEEIHYFSVADQRSSDIALTEITASPCRELLLTDDVRARAAALADQHPELIEMLDKIAQGHPVDGMEALSPVLVDGMELLIDLLPADTHVLICDPELVRGRSIELVKTSEEFLHASGSSGRWRQGTDRSGCIGIPAACRGSRCGTRPRDGVVDAVAVQCWSGGWSGDWPFDKLRAPCDQLRTPGAHPDRGWGRSSISRHGSADRVSSRGPSGVRSARPIVATPRRPSTTSPSGSGTAGAWS